MSLNKAFFNGPGGMVVPRLAADPASGLNGEIYYNTATNKFRAYENGAWGDSSAANAASKSLDNLTAPTAVSESLLMAAGKTLRLPNNTYLLARNAANSADIDVLKVNASNRIQVGYSTDYLESASGFVSLFSNSGLIELGSENIDIYSLSANDPVIRIWDAPYQYNVALTIPAGLAASYTLTLPLNDGSAGQYLQTDGSGVLSWQTISDTGITQLTGDVTAGPGSGSQAATIAANAVNGAKFRLANNEYLRARNAANSADVNILKVDASDRIDIGIGDGNRVFVAPDLNIVSLDANDTIQVGAATKIDLTSEYIRLLPYSTNPSEIRFYDGDGANYMAIKTIQTLGANYSLTLPVNDGASGEVLSTNGSGVLSWLDLSAPALTSVALTGGSGTQIAISAIYCDNSENIQAFEVDYVIKDTTTNDQRFGKLIAVISDSVTPTASLSDVLNVQTASIPYVFSLVVTGDRATLNYTSTGANNATMNYSIKRMVIA